MNFRKKNSKMRLGIQVSTRDAGSCQLQTESDEGVAWNHLNNFVLVIQKFQSILKQI